MEEKLASYRLRKRRTKTINRLKEKFFRMVSINVGGGSDKKDETKVNIEVKTRGRKLNAQDKNFVIIKFFLKKYLLHYMGFLHKLYKTTSSRQKMLNFTKL
jgi:hypothetical protein